MTQEYDVYEIVVQYECLHHALLLRRRVRLQGRYFVALYCTGCGGVVGLWRWSSKGGMCLYEGNLLKEAPAQHASPSPGR